ACVIYHSDSTGQAKGVMVTHRNVVNFFAGMDSLLGTEPAVWLAVTSISFDISVQELFWALSRGYKVILRGEENDFNRTNGEQLSVPAQIARHRVTHLQCTPSLAGTLVLTPESIQAMRSLSMLLLGGEALPFALAARLREVVGGGLLNMYGPTETTVWSTAHRFDKNDAQVFIGKPIVNTQIYILDGNLQPVPAGVPGEVFIGGEGVARGYLNRPELTAERFIANPLKVDRNQKCRLYRTGDRARFRTDGTIEF